MDETHPAIPTFPEPRHPPAIHHEGHGGHGATMDLTENIIGAAIAVHRVIGPGLLESAYESCLAAELAERGLRFVRQYPVPVVYKGTSLQRGYRVDLLVERQVMVELKSVSRIERIHVAQLLSYMRLSGCRVGLLINFNVELLKDGVRRVLLGTPDPSVCSVFSVVKRAR